LPRAKLRTTQPQNFMEFFMITVGYGDRTLMKAGFNKEGTFGPSFGRILSGKTSKTASGRPSAGRGPFIRLSPVAFGQKIGPKVPLLNRHHNRQQTPAVNLSSPCKGNEATTSSRVVDFRLWQKCRCEALTSQHGYFTHPVPLEIEAVVVRPHATPQCYGLGH
jgi:hypothetical protein